MSDQKSFKINYPNLQPLLIGFTRASGIIAWGIQLFRGILKDKAAPNHAFIVTEDHGQYFATEETLSGLQECSLEQYTKKGNRIVAMYSWVGFNDRNVRETVQRYLAEIRRRAGENSKYDFQGLLSFIPGLKLFFKPDPTRQWCSENVATILKSFGATFIDKVELAPDQLMKKLSDKSDECKAFLNYYI